MAGFLSSLMRQRRDYRRHERMSRAELEALQLEKFRALVNHAHAHSPYYRRLIEQRSIDPARCVPADFPVLTKPELIEHFDDIVTDRRLNKAVITEFLSNSIDPNDLLFGQYHVIHTSGSSGQVGYFVFSEADWGRGVAQGARRGLGNDKWHTWRPRLAFFGATGGHFGGVSLASTLRRGLLSMFVRTRLLEVNSPLPNVIADLNRFQPHVLVGYTTALKILAEKQLSGELDIAPVAVGTSGESQSAADRALLKQAFGCQVQNTYGCSEHLMMAFSRQDGDDMVLFDDDFILEFYDDHSVVTNLFNYTLPLIRYQMADILQPIPDDHSAEPYQVIRSLVGRTEIVPTFINRDGSEDFISPFTIIELFIPGVTRFQMRLLSKTAFELAICPEANDAQGRDAAVRATEQRLREVLAQKHMDNVEFDVVVVDDLPVNEKTGKFQLIVDRSAKITDDRNTDSR